MKSLFFRLKINVSLAKFFRKYEEICAPQVEEFCYITDNTYFKDEVGYLVIRLSSVLFLCVFHYCVLEQVLQMEAEVLKYLKFEMTAPTAKCFLR